MKRDLTDTEIRRDFLQPITAERLAVERAKAANTRRNWERDAIETAVGGVMRAFLAEGGVLRYDNDEHEFVVDNGPIRELDASASRTWPRPPRSPSQSLAEVRKDRTSADPVNKCQLFEARLDRDPGASGQSS